MLNAHGLSAVTDIFKGGPNGILTQSNIIIYRMQYWKKTLICAGMDEGEVSVYIFENDKSLRRISFTIFSKMSLLSELIEDIINPTDLETNNLKILDFILSKKIYNVEYKIPYFCLCLVFGDTYNEHSNVFG